MGNDRFIFPNRHVDLLLQNQKLVSDREKSEIVNQSSF